MQYDPEIWNSKYYAYQNELRSMGLSAENGLNDLYDLDGVVVWGPPEPNNSMANRRRLWLQFRQRGCFISVPGLKTFKFIDVECSVTITANLATVLHKSEFESVLEELIREAKLIHQDAWYDDEAAEQRLAWEKCGWFALPRHEETQAWSHFSDRLLAPGGDLRPPAAALTWGIPDLSGFTPDARQKAEGLLTLAVFDALKCCSPEGQHVLALDWDHPCYRFFPHQGIRKPYWDYWAVPVWPRGDSHYFVAPGFEYGVLASRAGKLHIFGQALAEASQAHVTKLLGLPESSC